MTVKDKVVVITGASSGIGKVTATSLAKQGARVILGARRENQLQEIVEEIKESGGQAAYHVTDVTKREDNQALVQKAIDTYGQIDAMYLNAGIMPNSKMSDLRVDDWDNMIDINLKGVLYGIAAAMPNFVNQKSGHFIATSSDAGIRHYEECGVYGATKWAIRNIMEVTRKESVAEGTNIKTTTIYPGFINTDLLDPITSEEVLASQKAAYEAHGIDSSSIANIVVYALSQPPEVNVSEFTVYPTNQA